MDRRNAIGDLPMAFLFGLKPFNAMFVEQCQERFEVVR